MKTNPNDPAQPLNDFALEKAEKGYGYSTEFAGLTKREHFAAMAMQGLITADPDRKISYVISEAIEAADALIKALNEETEK